MESIQEKDSPGLLRHILFRTGEFLRMLIVPGILLIAFWFLHNVLKSVNYTELKASLYATPRQHVLNAILLCGVNYLILTLYDILAFRYIRHPLAVAKVGFTAFISFAFSQTVGFALLSGGAIRYRLYSGWGCSAQQIAKVIAFSGLHFWMGLFLLSGVACLIDPANTLRILPQESILTTLNLSNEFGSRLIGLIFLGLIATYLVLTMVRRESLYIGRFEIPMPSTALASLALVVACLDWVIVAAILHALLPGQVGFDRVLISFLLSQAAGVLSHVPGGLGVFEYVMVLLFSDIPKTALLASLLLFRSVYYLLPFVIAVCLLVAYELRTPFASVLLKKAVQPVDAALSGIVPPLLALNAFIAGAVLMFSGVMPVTSSRMWWIKDIVPLPLVELSHFLNSIIAAFLMLLAWSIWKRVEGAYTATLLCLGAGIVVSLVKGLDYEEAVLLVLVGFVLFRCRRYFYRKAPLFSALREETIVAFLVVVACSVWLGFFAYRHIDDSTSLLQQFAESNHAARFARGSVGALLVLLLIGLKQFFTRSEPPTPVPSREDFPKIREILARYGGPVGNLTFLLDKYVIFSERGDGFLMYRHSGRTWVALGDPIGDDDSRQELIWRFRDLADHHDGLSAFYLVPPQSLYRYVDVGLRFIRIGEVGLIDISSFSPDAEDARGVIEITRRLEAEGFRFNIVDPSSIAGVMPALTEISRRWQANTRASETGFSHAFFNEQFLQEFPVAIVSKEDTPVAFTVVMPSESRESLSIELFRHVTENPYDVLDFLYVKLILWGRQQHYRQLSLGLTPLTGHETKQLAEVEARLGTPMYDEGEHFATLANLRKYKERFSPQWEPRYLVYQGKISLARTLRDVATLIGSGPSNLLAK